MTVYRAYVHLGSNEWGNELMQKVADAYAAEHAERPLIVCVYEHAGWDLSFLYGAPGVRDGTICGTANDDAVLPRGVLEFGKSIDGERFWETFTVPEFLALHHVKAVLFHRKEQAMNHILYAATLCGYCVQVMQGGEIVYEYSAGNCGKESQSVIDPSSPNAVNLRQLNRWAVKTARAIAEERRIPADRISYDPDLEAELKEADFFALDAACCGSVC